MNLFMYYIIEILAQLILLLLLLLQQHQGDSDDDDSDNNNDDDNRRRRRRTTAATRQAHANIERNIRQREQAAFVAVRGVVFGGSQDRVSIRAIQELRRENPQKPQQQKQMGQLVNYNNNKHNYIQNKTFSLLNLLHQL
jgi:hypothetical protein